MEEQQGPQHRGYSNTTMPLSETDDCKLTDFMGKKGEKAHEEVPVVHLEMVDKRKETDLNEAKYAFIFFPEISSNMLPVVEISNSTTDEYLTSSDEEVEEDGETKKRKKKGLKDKIKEKISRTTEEDCTNPKDTFIAMEEGYTEEENGETTNSEENKRISGEDQRKAFPPAQED
nr:phosphoprotein ECPP44-like [Coffea arabica]